MDVYYFVIFITLLLCYNIKVQDGDSKAYLKKIIWILVPVFIYGALRVNFGIDYPEYEREYYELHGHFEYIDKEAHAELGYQWLNVIMPTWRSLLILVSSLVVVSFGFLYYKYVEPKMLLIVMVFTLLYPDQSFFMNFVTMRNGLAIAGFFLSVPLIVKRKYFLVLPIAAGLSFLHTSAIIFVPMALIVGFNTPLKKKEILIWGAILVIFASMSASNLIEHVLPMMSADQFESYRERYLQDTGHSSWLNGLACTAMIYWVFSWAYRNRESLTMAQNTIWRLSMLYLMCPFLGPIGRTRLNYYFFPFYIITISYMIKDTWPNQAQKRMFIVLAIAVMLYATFYVWMHNPNFPFAHYTSIFG